jgi:diguanylate cyclase (GGDEF)-like protein
MNHEIRDVTQYLLHLYEDNLKYNRIQMVYLRGGSRFLRESTSEALEELGRIPQPPTVHTFRCVGRIHSPYFPFLPLIKARFQTLEEKDKARFFSAAKIYKTLQLVFWSYLNEETIRREEEVIHEEIQFEQQKVFQGVQNLLKLLFDGQPLVVFIDNAHNIPLSSLQFLNEFLESRRIRFPLMLVFTSWRLFTGGGLRLNTNWEEAISKILSNSVLIDFGSGDLVNRSQQEDLPHPPNLQEVLQECFYFLALEEGTQFFRDYFQTLNEDIAPEEEVRLWLFTGTFYHNSKDYDNALIYFQSLVHNPLVQRNPDLQAEVMHRMGQVFLMKNNLSQAMKYAALGAKLVAESQNLTLKLMVYSGFLLIEDKDNSLEKEVWRKRLFEVQSMAESLGWVNTHCFWLAPNDRFHPLYEAEEAQALLDRSFDMAKKLGNSLRVAACHHIQGVYLTMWGDFRKAEVNYKKSESIKRKIGNPIELSKVQNGLGYFYFQTFDYKQAEKYFAKAFNSAFQGKDFMELGMAVCNLGINSLFRFDFDGAGDRFHTLVNIMMITQIDELPYHSSFGIHSMMAISYFLAGNDSRFLEAYLAIESRLSKSNRRTRVQTYTEEEFLFFLATAVYHAYYGNHQGVKQWMEQGKCYFEENKAIILYFEPFLYAVLAFLARLIGEDKQAKALWKTGKKASEATGQTFYREIFLGEPGRLEVDSQKSFRRASIAFDPVIEAAYTNNLLSQLHRKVNDLDFLNSFQAILSHSDNREGLLKKAADIVLTGFSLDLVSLAFLDRGRVENDIILDYNHLLPKEGVRRSIRNSLIHSGPQYLEVLPAELGLGGVLGEEVLISIPLALNNKLDQYLHLICYTSGHTNRLAKSDFDILYLAAKQLQTNLEKSIQDLEIKRINEKLQSMNAELYQKATTDVLTGLYNRGFFIQKLEEIIRKVNRAAKDNSYSLMFLDLDNFKPYNDTYGHDMGDRVLREFSNLLIEATRDSDYPTRWGGDEFIVLLPKTPLSGAKRAAERVLSSFSDGGIFYNLEGFLAPGQKQVEGVPQLTCSIGLVTNQGKTEVDDLIRMADESLYTAKKEGKNRLSIYPGQEVYLGKE